MSDLKLSFAMTAYDRILPLISGEVKPDGITLEYTGMPGGFSRVFYDQMKFKRYDVSEMSVSSFLRVRPVKWPYRMLPVFHNRNFSYTLLQIRRGSGIRQDHPEDLKGKRFGIGDYQQTAALWTRGILQSEFGVKPEDMIWYQERGEHLSHTGASAEVGLSLPPGVKIHYARTDLGTMLLKGELDVELVLHSHKASDASGISRKRGPAQDNPEMTPLFSDTHHEAVRFFRKAGVYPPHHTTVVRESIVEEHPWVAVSLMDAFEESKRIAMKRLRQLPPTLMVFGEHYLKEVDDLFGADPFPYGIKANARAIDMVQTFSLEQGLTERKQPLDEIFPMEVIYLDERG